MTEMTHDPKLTDTIYAILMSRRTGQAVANQLLHDTKDWTRRSLIADLRTRRVQMRYDRAVSQEETRAARHDLCMSEPEREMRP